MSPADATIASLMDEVKNMRADDPALLEKMQNIAEQVAAAKRTSQPAAFAVNNLTDPAEALGCEGCQ